MPSMTVALFALVPAVGAPHPAPTIRGDYVEARTADVYTGPCFSNSEVYLSGELAIAAWKVERGSFRGVALDGLSVAAAIEGDRTFSEDDPTQAKSVVIVDRAATPEQKEALVAFARSMAKGRLDHIVVIKTSLLDVTVEGAKHLDSHGDPAAPHCIPQAAVAQVWAPGLAQILARPLGSADQHCGNEVVAYAPLSAHVDVKPAFTLANKYSGDGLGSTWSDAQARGCFVGGFAVPAGR